MKNSSHNRAQGYNLGFTSGALLKKEADLYISNITSPEHYHQGVENLDYSLIPMNSDAGKRRIKSELDSRLQPLNIAYITHYKHADETDRKVILYLSMCAHYTILAEFALEVLYLKWKQFNADVTTYDFEYFLAKKLGDNINRISDKTKYKLAQVAIKVYKELGILKNNAIAQVYPSGTLTQLLNKNGDGWLLSCLLIPNEN